MIFTEIIFVIVAYFVGNLNFAYIVVKLKKNEDVRDYGSGNAGTTNVLRTLGKNYALPVFVLDALKGSLVIIAGRLLGLEELHLVLGGLAVVAGHNWPLFLQFRGGKGTATSLGVFLTFDWQVALIAIAIGIAVLIIWKMVSLTSMVGLSVLWIISLVMGRSLTEILFSVALCLFSLFQHRQNIGRIIQGKESKIGQKVKMK